LFDHGLTSSTQNSINIYIQLITQHNPLISYVYDTAWSVGPNSKNHKATVKEFAQ
jgi:hypothetical protein